MIKEINEQQFEEEVLNSDKAVVVDFWAPWCGPCKMVAPVLEEIDQERDDVDIVKVNIDDNPQTAARYGIMSIPTMLLFSQGAIAGQVVGAQPKGKIIDSIEAVLNPSLS